MDHSHHGHDHPQTFDEVIARGFPRDGRAPAAVEAAIRRRAPRPAPPRLEAATRVVTRVDQDTWGEEEKKAFKNAVQKLVDDGTYLQLIQHHIDMSHVMHGSMGVVGLYRFLAWHRRYLVAFERELQRVDTALRGSAAAPIAVPYWRWQDPFPAWLDGFLPAKDPVSGAQPGPRKKAAPPNKAAATDVDIIVNQFSIQQTGLAGENDYTKFTWGVEGWGRRPNQTGLPAHNHGHSWVGGIMNNTSTSPTDPLFWLHHAEVDRLWSRWRDTHATVRPLLQGAQLVMDPWAETYDDLVKTDPLGYTYPSGPL